MSEVPLESINSLAGGVVDAEASRREGGACGSKVGSLGFRV